MYCPLLFEVLPPKKKRKVSGGGDPLKGGFLRGPKRGDVTLTEAEAAAAKIKVKVNAGVNVALMCTWVQCISTLHIR